MQICAYIQTSHGKYKCMFLSMIVDQHIGTCIGESVQVCICSVGKHSMYWIPRSDFFCFGNSNLHQILLCKWFGFGDSAPC